jgi:hypothetical protein
VPAVPPAVATSVPKVDTLHTQFDNNRDVMYPTEEYESDWEADYADISGVKAPAADDDGRISNLSLFQCTVTDEELGTIWDTAALRPESGLTFQIFPRAPTEADYAWTHTPRAERMLSIEEAQQLVYLDVTSKQMDSGASSTVMSKALAKRMKAPIFKRPQFRANMAKKANEFGDEFCVFIIAMRGQNSRGEEVVQEFGVQALLIEHVANDLLVGDSTLARAQAALYVAEGTMTLFEGKFSTQATKSEDLPEEKGSFQTHSRPSALSIGSSQSSARLRN